MTKTSHYADWPISDKNIWKWIIIMDVLILYVQSILLMMKLVVKKKVGWRFFFSQLKEFFFSMEWRCDVVHCTDCKTHWHKVILSFMNESDFICYSKGIKTQTKKSITESSPHRVKAQKSSDRNRAPHTYRTCLSCSFDKVSLMTVEPQIPSLMQPISIIQ